MMWQRARVLDNPDAAPWLRGRLIWVLAQRPQEREARGALAPVARYGPWAAEMVKLRVERVYLTNGVYQGNPIGIRPEDVELLAEFAEKVEPYVYTDQEMDLRRERS